MRKAIVTGVLAACFPLVPAGADPFEEAVDGAIIGGVIGAVADGKKGAVKGAAIGAAAGAVSGAIAEREDALKEPVEAEDFEEEVEIDDFD